MRAARHWRTSTFVAGLCATGFVAPFVFDQAMNGNIFRQYVRDQLAPLLRAGDTTVMDNLASHKVSGIRALIEASGAARLYLPAYSPDLNPIELAFAKLKPCSGPPPHAPSTGYGARSDNASASSVQPSTNDTSNTQATDTRAHRV